MSSVFGDLLFLLFVQFRLISARVQVADVMCFYSEAGGLLPDRVSTLQEVVSLHLKVPSSQLLSLQLKAQLTTVQRTASSTVGFFTVYLHL